jgi:hypothetical protein
MAGTFSVPERRPRSWPPPDALVDDQRTGALGTADLVRRQRHGMDAVAVELAEIERDLAEGLHRIGVEPGAARSRFFG